MNERIKELAEQAGDYADTQVNTHGCDACGECDDCINWCDVYNSKFAELIVKECANRLRTEMEQYDRMPGREISAQTMETAQVLIKNHFGVEE